MPIKTVRALCGATATMILTLLNTINAAEYSVKKDGSGNFVTIQACADTAKAGDSCLVYPGIYNERILTKVGGTSSNPNSCKPLEGAYPYLTVSNQPCDAQRITFKAVGDVTLTQFFIRHPYITVDGFKLTGSGASSYDGYITLAVGGNYANVINNKIFDGSPRIYGINFTNSMGEKASYCTVRNNTINNMRYVIINVTGNYNLIEKNTILNANGMDVFRSFGHDNVYRRNLIRYGVLIPDVQNHPDIIQTFADNGGESYNIIFEENWIEDLVTQLGQMNSGVPYGSLSPNFHDYMFRSNVFVNITQNFNQGLPGIHFINNTFFKFASTQLGITMGGGLTRTDPSRALIKNNAFIESGASPDGNGFRGFYNLNPANMSKEVLLTHVYYSGSAEPVLTYPTEVEGIFADLLKNKYVNSNGYLTDTARAVTSIQQLQLDPAYSSYKTKLYDVFDRTLKLDALISNTFIADYNFVAGTEAEGYPAKKVFKETHGINGGNPFLKNKLNPLGPDQLPFTLDDGLKPSASSPLCGQGEGGRDIGALSCEATRVLANQTGNQDPIVYAGSDQIGTWPSTIKLQATISDDGLPNNSLSIEWKLVNGPGMATFSNKNSATSNVTFSEKGTYVLRVSVFDGELSTSDDITIRVGVTVSNMAPTISVGSDLTVSVLGTAHIQFLATDDGQIPPTVTWTQVSGPGATTFENQTSLSVRAKFSTTGIYVLRATASDGSLSAQDEIRITVIGGNSAPNVDAGENKTVSANQLVTMTGLVSDDGLPNETLVSTWTFLTGPSEVQLTNRNNKAITVTLNVAGTYLFRLEATDGLLSSSDEVSVTVVNGSPIETPSNNIPSKGKNVFTPKNGDLLLLEPLVGTQINRVDLLDRQGVVLKSFDHVTESTTWDGRNEKGDLVSAGVYLVRAENRTKRIVVLK